ncbi:hypothetical protein BGW36DRAFT_377972 [Talaromyces proteolyticus]|uniref:NmrA-like domain-containing protein n=1 Tax=Talaromyces proteolyticus TaxID=1131652 RepID=A0AAD4KNV9_9EURO|nr:uncharacterized protein BGW36DRAFT_377972 [Talaromyces proteolyticus]KAH8697118.1 hypothetical protein BGW36DRAFT_377972 [Talaromyces proteolyticus]
MVHVVFVGGGGNVGRDIVDEIVKQGEHQVTVFSRKTIPDLTESGVNVVTIKNYSDQDELTSALRGVHTVLSFISWDPGNVAQKSLIGACIAAGVKRFAPTQWGIRSKSGFPGYAPKDEVHEYLQQLNADGPVLEYCLFQPGVFMNYLAHPLQTAKHLYISGTHIDVVKKHVLIVEDGEAWYTYTTIQDTAKVVARALSYPGKWPETGGFYGGRAREKDVVKLVEEIKGEPFERHVLRIADLEKGEFNSSWIPVNDHPNMPPEFKGEGIMRQILPAFLLAAHRGAADVDPVWNSLLPDLQLEDVETFLRRVLK